MRSVLAVLLLVALVGACDPPPPSADASLSLAGTLGGGDTLGYARAMGPVAFSFPSDHGPHEAFRTEWWYVTGHLESEEGHRFGYQFTLFRSALAATDATAESAWSTRQAYMGHFALTDITAGAFHAHERFARGAVGLAGARSEPLRVWLEDWELRSAVDSVGAFPISVRALGDSVGLSLTLEEGKGIVLNGDRGWSPKSSEPGNASYYYAMPRMPTEGTVRVGERTHRVTGQSWLDREWSTSVLADDQVGWDWFAIQLDDGRDVMAYRMRRSDGSDDPASEGTLTGPDGRARRLAWGDDVEVEVTDRWRAPDGAAEYPAGWILQLPAEGLTLRVEPLVADQELRLTFRYWEGAVSVTGEGPDGPVTGRGYVELTGYDRAESRWR